MGRETVLVTGATGFIGSHLVQQLIKRGHKVYALIRHSPNPFRNIPDGVITITGDILDYYNLVKTVKATHPKYVFHLAALTPVRHSFNNPFIYEETNYRGTMNMIHASLKSPVLKRFIVASTMEVYRHKDTPLKETDELYGSTPYGVSKVAADNYIRVAGDCYGLPYTILRCCNTYGRKTEKGYFIEKVITTMLTEKILKLNGSPNSVRSFMYVDDHVRAYLYCMKEEAENQVFNFGPEKGNSIGEIVDAVRKILDWKGKVFYGMNPRPSEAKRLEIDPLKAMRTLNWYPRYVLTDGLYETIGYWRKKLNEDSVG